MAGFDETIVREYFELNNFFVRQLHKHAVQTRKKQVEDVSDLVIYNPAAPVAVGRGFQLFASDMEKLRFAIVGIKSWNTSKFSPAMLKSSPKTLEFLKKEVVAKIDAFFQTDRQETDETPDPYADYPKLLVIPAYPKNDAHRDECTALLKEKGVDGVITCSTILESLLKNVAVNHSYPNSELLQLLRVLKVYDMIREPQMSLF
ncbi:MAG: hypothetical protein ACSHYA_18745 [Opitutaceae bacterium]